MLPINVYPYLNLNDFNLDYILKTIGELRYEVTNFVSLNAIKYADPIQWDITRQYEKNTVVIDPLTGTAYISVAPVPMGVALTNTDYWCVVFDLGSFVTRAAQNFTSNWESETTSTATFSLSTGEWLVWGDVLYKALTNITAGDTYVVGGNIDHFTMEDVYNEYLNTIASILAIVGDLVDLTTSDKTSIVNAINSVVSDIAALDLAINTKVGDLADLDTTDKSDIVHAINEVNKRAISSPRKNLLINADFTCILDQFWSLICPENTSYYSDTALTTYIGQTPNALTALWVSESYAIINIGGVDYYVAFNDCKHGYIGISRASHYTYAPWLQGSNIITFYNLRHLKGIGMKPISTFNSDCYMAQVVNVGDDKLDGIDGLRHKALTMSIVIDGVVYSETFTIDERPVVDTTLAMIDETDFVLKLNYKAQAYQDTGYLWFVIQPKTYIVVEGVKIEIGDSQTLADENGVIIDPPAGVTETSMKQLQFEYNPFWRSEAVYLSIGVMGRYNTGNSILAIITPPLPFLARPSMDYDDSIAPLYIQQAGNTIPLASVTGNSLTEECLLLRLDRDTSDPNIFNDVPFLLQRRNYRTHISFYWDLTGVIMI